MKPAQKLHYRVGLRHDFIPYRDWSGATREEHTIIELNTHEDAPFHDHTILSPTYRDSIKGNGEFFIRTRGRGE